MAVIFFFSGCRSLKLYMNLKSDEVQIEKLEIAMAFFKSSKPKKIYTIGIAIPPPPIPPTLLKSMTIPNNIEPIHSTGVGGHNALCSQTLAV